MTDAVRKGLEIESLISSSSYLNTEHVPIHLLCKSHSVEAVDKSNLKVLGKYEKRVQLQEKMVKIYPTLKPFFRGKLL